jgi:hypothetical protein
MVSQHYFLTFGQNVEDLNMYKFVMALVAAAVTRTIAQEETLC